MTEKIITAPPTPDEMLTASLKLIVEEFVNMGYDERIIFGKVNLIKISERPTKIMIYVLDAT